MPMDKREEELKIAEILIQSAIAIGLLGLQFWAWLGKATMAILAVYINLVVIGTLVLIGFYLALIGEKKK
jgi:fatty acid desaturase